MVSPTDHFEFEFSKKFSSHDVFPIAEEWQARLKVVPGILAAEISGELRRGKYSLDHIDLVLATENTSTARGLVLDALYPLYIQDDRADHICVLLPSGVRMVIWLAQPENFMLKLLLTTGSENHLAQLANRASSQGLLLTSSSLQKNGQALQFQTEEQIYATLNLPWIPPELRESGSEVEKAHALELDQLIQSRDLLCDLHMHSTWSDGKDCIEDMAAAAMRRGFTHMAICDHSPYLLKKYSDAAYLAEQTLEIERIQKGIKNGFKILKGVEVDILPDGSLDLSDETLKKMDIVVASMHVALDQPVSQATERLIRAVENPHVHIIGHPGGRIYPMVDVMDLDWERVYRAAAFNQVALEINSHKSHPIFDEHKARTAAALGALIALNSDAHHTAMLSNARFGLAIARRAELTRDQVINTWSLSHLKLWLRHKRELISKGR